MTRRPGLVVEDGGADHGGMTLQAVPNPEAPAGRWVWEAARGSTRAVRVSPHAQSGLVAVSLWRGDGCVGSLRLAPSEVSSLIAKLSAALAELTTAPRGGDPAGAPEVANRLKRLETRLAALEDSESERSADD